MAQITVEHFCTAFLQRRTALTKNERYCTLEGQFNLNVETCNSAQNATEMKTSRVKRKQLSSSTRNSAAKMKSASETRRHISQLFVFSQFGQAFFANVRWNPTSHTWCKEARLTRTRGVYGKNWYRVRSGDLSSCSSFEQYGQVPLWLKSFQTFTATFDSFANLGSI